MAREQYRWIALAAASMVAALLLCAVVTPYAKTVPPLPSLNAADEADPTLRRYQSEAPPDIVLVGSSLTYRLLEDYFRPLRIRNLAIPGDSAMTGLEIIASYPRVPRLILIETNILNRFANTKLVERFSHHQRDRELFIRPVRTAVSYVVAARPPSPAPINSAVLDNLLSSPPVDHDNAAVIDWAAEIFSKSDQDQAIQANAKLLGQQVSELIQRGSHVYLYELPLPEKIANSHFAKLTRAAAREAVPNSSLWLDLSYPLNQLRFLDHTHLDERSALIAAKSIAQAVDKLRLPSADAIAK
ncbi:hypothetical protein ABIF99_010103 [Bradyrhizobium japonicum]